MSMEGQHDPRNTSSGVDPNCGDDASIAVLSLAATHGARADDAAGAYCGSGCVQVVDAYGQVVTRC